jgi:hypothetical protein
VNKESVYRNITLFCVLPLIIGLFVNVKDPVKDAKIDLLYDVIALLTYTFAFLWIKRRILLIGLVLFLIDFNIRLIFNPIILIHNTAILTMTLKWIGMGFNFLGFICVLIGFWNRLDNNYLISEPKFGLRPTFTLIIFFTLIFQLTIRSI